MVKNESACFFPVDSKEREPYQAFSETSTAIELQEHLESCGVFYEPGSPHPELLDRARNTAKPSKSVLELQEVLLRECERIGSEPLSLKLEWLQLREELLHNPDIETQTEPRGFARYIALFNALC